MAQMLKSVDNGFVSANTAPAARFEFPTTKKGEYRGKKTTLDTREVWTFLEQIPRTDLTAQTVLHSRLMSWVNIIPDVKPIRPWKPADPGSVEKFEGALVADFPQLAKLSEDEVEQVFLRTRRKSCDTEE